LCLRLENGVREVGVGVLLVVGTIFGRMVLVLLRVDAETLCDEVYIDSVNMFNQTSDWGHNLLGNVPLSVNRQLALLR